jgi:hypothetical protein
MVEVLSVLALATKQVKEGRLSKCVTLSVYHAQCFRREICEEAGGRERG